MVTTFSTVALNLLSAAAAALAPDAPSRQFVSHNAPAWDLCEEDQLTVHLGNTTFRQPRDDKMGPSMARPLWVLQLVRCVPGPSNSGAAPSADALTASATGLLDDFDAIQAAVRADPAGIFGGCRAVQFGQAVPLGPAGQVGGYSWPIGAEIIG